MDDWWLGGAGDEGKVEDEEEEEMNEEQNELVSSPIANAVEKVATINFKDVIEDYDDDDECNIDYEIDEDDTCPALRRDVASTLKAYPRAEREVSIPSAEIKHSITCQESAEYCSVTLTLVLSDLPRKLRQIWELEDTLSVSIILDRVHRLQYRCYSELPSVSARKYGEKGPSKFTVGETLTNATRSFLNNIYHLNMSDRHTLGMHESIFNVLYDHLVLRLNQLSDYCMVCSTKLYAGGFLPTICHENDLCVYQYNDLGLYSGMVGPRVSSDVLALLLFILSAANSAEKREMVLVPKPSVKHETAFVQEVNKMMQVGHGQVVQDVQSALTSLVSAFHCPRSILSTTSAYGAFKDQWPQCSKLVEWLVMSNGSYLERVPDSMVVPLLGTTTQFIFVADSPEKQAQFDQLVRENGGKTRFLFHGSPAYNWHSIIRAGLKNMSGTSGQLNGAAHGAGIYTSPDLGTSMTYAKEVKCASRLACQTEQCCLYTANGMTWNLVALVEVVETPAAYRQTPNPSIIVVQEEKYCSIRMLLLYPQGGAIQDCSLTNMSADQRNKIGKVMETFKNGDLKERAKHAK